MSKKLRLDRKIGFQNTFNTKCINVIIDSIGPSIILRSIIQLSLSPSLALEDVGDQGSHVVSVLKWMLMRAI